MKKEICQDCKAIVKSGEYHPFEYCLIAKAYPNRWREIIDEIVKDKKEAQKCQD